MTDPPTKAIEDAARDEELKRADERIDILDTALRQALQRLHFYCREDAERIAEKAGLPAPEQPKIPTHRYVPHPKWPWFCKHCGYPEHERLKHDAAPEPDKGDQDGV